MKSLAELEALVDKEENWAEHFECEQPVYKSCVLDATGCSVRTVQKILSKWSKSVMIPSVKTPSVQDGLKLYAEDICRASQSSKVILETDTHYVVLQSWDHSSGKGKMIKLSMGIIKKQAEY